LPNKDKLVYEGIFCTIKVNWHSLAITRDSISSSYIRRTNIESLRQTARSGFRGQCILCKKCGNHQWKSL